MSWKYQSLKGKSLHTISENFWIDPLTKTICLQTPILPIHPTFSPGKYSSSYSATFNGPSLLRKVQNIP